MKIFKLVIVLCLVSLQVQATGYAHNMFVAQKKLQTKKEVTSDKKVDNLPQKIKAVENKQNKPHISKAHSFHMTLGNSFEINDETIEHGSILFFNSEEETKQLGTSIVSKIGTFIKHSILLFISSLF